MELQEAFMELQEGFVELQEASMELQEASMELQEGFVGDFIESHEIIITYHSSFLIYFVPLQPK